MKKILSRLIGTIKRRKLVLIPVIISLIIFIIIRVVNAEHGNTTPTTESELAYTQEVKGESTQTESPSPSPSTSPIVTSTAKPSSTPSSNQSQNNNQSPTPSSISSQSQPTSTPIQSTQTPTPTQAPQQTQAPQASAITVKVLNIFFVPAGVTPNYNPSDLSNALVNGTKESSHNILNYQIVETQQITRSTTKNSSGRMDYNTFLDEFNICSKVNSGEIDETWIWVNGGDGAGFEYTASGPSMNDPYSGMKSCGKNMFVMGFDYTRTWDLALHSMGHRMEFAAKHNHQSEYLGWDSRNHRYSSPYNTEVPLENGVVGCGNIHFPPNAKKHYDYSNSANVQSNCTGSTQTITCSIWGCNQEGFLKWWFSYVPSNWWSSFVGK